MRLSELENDPHAVINGIGLGCRICVALSDHCAGFDLRLHFHGSPSFWSSYVYGTGLENDPPGVSNGIGLGCRICVGLSDGCAGFDVRLHFHGSPSFWSSYVYGTGNGTLAVKEHDCHGGIALAHQPWSVPFMDRYPCQFFRTVSYPKGLCQANCVNTKLTP
jgi:hypothetical protein